MYGAVRASTGGSGPKHKFVGALGHPSEDETGLVYMRARYMDPVTGRFVSEDPAFDHHNWFSYASQNPVNVSDPSGRADLFDPIKKWMMKEVAPELFLKIAIWLEQRGLLLIASGRDAMGQWATEMKRGEGDGMAEEAMSPVLAIEGMTRTMSAGVATIGGATQFALGLAMVAMGRCFEGLAYIYDKY